MPDLMIPNAILLILLILLAYAWVGYPLILGGLARIARRRPSGSPGSGMPVQARRVSVILAAYNEEDVIRGRLKNLVAAGGASAATTSGFNIHLGLDACTDGTAAIAREFASSHPFVYVHEFIERRGKAAVLKDLARIAGCGEKRSGGPSAARERNEDASHSDFLIFTDANTHFAADAIDRLLGHFDHPEVGGVCGRLVFVKPGGDMAGPVGQAKADEGFYWEWETRLKTAESAVDSCLGANGAIYAIRASLFPSDFPDNAVVDDFVIGMKVREQGFRMVYEPEAVAYEEAAPEVGDEWVRRVRIGAGDFQALVLCRRCLLPRYGLFAWMFWSHKVLRWLTPHMILLVVGLAVGGVWTTEGLEMMLSASVLAAMGLFLGLAAVGRMLRGSRGRVLALFRLCDYFLIMQAAIFAGFLRFCRGGLAGAWTRTARTRL
ncbi:MAG: glycosyltransferase [bacterium]